MKRVSRSAKQPTLKEAAKQHMAARVNPPQYASTEYKVKGSK